MLDSSSIYSSQETQHTPSVPSYLFDETRDASFFAWWYRFTTPSEYDILVSPNAQKRVRHARAMSRALLVALLLVLIGFPLTFFGLNPLLMLLLTMACLVLLIALFLNRSGHSLLAAMMLVVLIEVGDIGTILLALRGVVPTTLPSFDLLVLPLVLTPCRLLILLANSVFTLRILRTLAQNELGF